MTWLSYLFVTWLSRPTRNCSEQRTQYGRTPGSPREPTPDMSNPYSAMSAAERLADRLARTNEIDRHLKENRVFGRICGYFVQNHSCNAPYDWSKD
jgi:hypothetical protein